MKKRFILFLFLFLLLPPVLAQQAEATFEPSLKYGKPSDEELSMTTYAPDTAATALVLYSKCNARYDLIANEFRIIYSYEVKIKVLKTDGTSSANINIPYYSNERGSSMKESVGQIDASAYNLEGGKMVRTKMKRDLVFEERLNKSYMQIKFSIPAVREGTVFEYKYQLTSDYYYTISHWEGQKDIPVLFTQYDITIPEYFQFNIEMRGVQSLTSKDESASLSYSLTHQNGQMEQITCTGRRLQFTGRQIPALRSDSYVWCANDYRSGVGFELRGVNFPGAIYQSFTRTWDEIDKMLLKDEDFGSLLKMRNPYREEMESLALDKRADRQEKISALYTFLKKRISWNKQYGLYGNEVKKAIKNGTGNNAEINFVLMSMLREAQIPCYPIVMSRKSMGVLPFTHPSVQKLNTFVVGIADTDSTYVFLDGSVTNGFLNTLPPVLMVDRARLISNENVEGDRWIDLSKLGHNQIRSFVSAQIQPDGVVAGQRQTSYSGQCAAEFRKRYQSAKDSMEFISKLETEENIKVKQFDAKDIQSFSPNVMESFEFEKQASVNDLLIYVNPMLFLHTSKCPFIQEERQLPLEMPYAERFSLAVSLKIPDGYTIDELPKSMNVKTEDGQGYCRYNIGQQGNQISLNYSFAFDKLVHLADEYKAVKSFWEIVAEKNNEILVLKKL